MYNKILFEQAYLFPNLKKPKIILSQIKNTVKLERFETIYLIAKGVSFNLTEFNSKFVIIKTNGFFVMDIHTFSLKRYYLLHFTIRDRRLTFS